jgi:hypothetical protein
MCQVLDDRTNCRLAFMSRNPKELPQGGSDAKFRQILAEVGRARAIFEELSERGDEGPRSSARPFANTTFSLDEKQVSMADGGSPWDAALAWIDEQDGPSAIIESRKNASESAEAILDELGLHDDLTFEELNQVRRLFMWRNHPDRHSEADRETATRRVAIANMLVDRAQARLSGGRRA